MSCDQKWKENIQCSDTIFWRGTAYKNMVKVPSQSMIYDQHVFCHRTLWNNPFCATNVLGWNILIKYNLFCPMFWGGDEKNKNLFHVKKHAEQDLGP